MVQERNWKSEPFSVRPLPTNVWWENFVLGGGDQVANVNPYIIKLLGDGVHVSLPTEVFKCNTANLIL